MFMSIKNHWFPPLYVMLDSWTIGTVDLYMNCRYGNFMVFWNANLIVVYATILYMYTYL